MKRSFHLSLEWCNSICILWYGRPGTGRFETRSLHKRRRTFFPPPFLKCQKPFSKIVNFYCFISIARLSFQGRQSLSPRTMWTVRYSPLSAGTWKYSSFLNVTPEINKNPYSYFSIQLCAAIRITDSLLRSRFSYITSISNEASRE